jgi:hypothetical protein
MTPDELEAHRAALGLTQPVRRAVALAHVSPSPDESRPAKSRAAVECGEQRDAESAQ